MRRFYNEALTARPHCCSIVYVSSLDGVPASTMHLDSSDSRFRKAMSLADQSGQWLKIRSNGKCVAVGIPSSQPGRYYMVTRVSCECEDFRRRNAACKHMQALEIAVIRAGEKPRPAADVLVGLAQMVENADRYDRIIGAAYADLPMGSSPLHFRDDTHYGTTCLMPLEGRAWTTTEADVTCGQCRQILDTRAQTAEEIRTGKFWERFR